MKEKKKLKKEQNNEKTQTAVYVFNYFLVFPLSAMQDYTETLFLDFA